MTEVQLNSKFSPLCTLLASLTLFSSCWPDVLNATNSAATEIRAQIQRLLKGEPEDEELLREKLPMIPWAQTLEILVGEIGAASNNSQPSSKTDILRAYQRLSLVNQKIRLQDSRRRLEEATERYKEAMESFRAAIEKAVAEESN